MTSTPRADVLVVGAGAAGLFAALAARGAIGADGLPTPPPADAPDVLLVDGMERPGRKIIVSGGGRCNVTHAAVDVADFVTAEPNLARSVLRSFGPAAVRCWFEARGVSLHEEPDGKVFPDSSRARDVLGALLDACTAAGVRTAFGQRVEAIAPDGDGWRAGPFGARRLILATGGRSVPKTGSDGAGYAWLEELGHVLVPPVPALVPLVAPVPEDLSGITLPAILTAERPDGRVLGRAAGSLLFTHRGWSGPAALDVSVAVARCRAADEPFRVTADFWTLADPEGPWARFRDLPKPPGACLAPAPVPATPRVVEDALIAAAKRDARTSVAAILGTRLPRRLIAFAVPAADRALSALSREERRAAADAVTRFDPGVVGTAGWDKAEVTAGGVSLRDLHRRTLESRKAPGLFVCGEVCDVTGRLGGFNFQWAWASGFVAGRGAAF